MEAGNEVEGVQSQEEYQEPNEQRKGLKVEGAAVREFAGCLFWLYQRRRGLWICKLAWGEDFLDMHWILEEHQQQQAY